MNAILAVSINNISTITHLYTGDFLKTVPSATADFILKVLGVYTRSMETIYISLVHTGS